MSGVPVEERVERVRAALHEAGYPDLDVYAQAWTVVVEGPAPGGVIWRAYVLADPTSTDCWPCWSEADSAPWEDPTDDNDPGPCGHDPLTSPWPEVVR